MAPKTAAPPASRPTPSAQPLHEEPAVGIRLRLPPGWQRKELSSGGVQVVIFSPQAGALATRISLLSFPRLYLPGGLKTREIQLRTALGKTYHRLKLGRAEGTQWPGEVLEYAVTGQPAHRSAEFAIQRGDRVVIVQFSSPAKAWPQLQALARRTLLTVELFEPRITKRASSSKTSPPPAKPFKPKTRIVSHAIELELDPATGRFASTDRLVLEALEERVAVAEFLVSAFETTRVEDRRGALPFELRPFKSVKRLSVKLRRPLRRGRKFTLTVTLSTPKFDFRTDKSPVGGYHVLGQVSPTSSYSSHVLYYPVDADNRAAARIRFHLPAGYTAVGPGKRVSIKRGKGRVTTTWRAADGLIKQLPYGWAVARYHEERGRSPSGTPIHIFALPEHKARAPQVLKVAADAITFFERRFGPFPFGGVSIAEVSPTKGIAGVSLPSLVLLSQRLFNGVSSYAQIKELQAAFRGPLVIVDELSHQYNFYSVALPNQLAEGLAQYTDSLFAEHVAQSDINEHFAYYSRTYRGAVSTAPDHPILSAAVYGTPAYMGIVFSKGACVLHMLRRQIGDQAFFKALRRFFRRFRGKRAGLAQLQQSAEQVSSQKLAWFFEQWYQRGGYPKFKLGWKQKGTELTVRLQQLQAGAPFRLQLHLVLQLQQGSRHVIAEVTKRKQSFSFTIPATATIKKVEPNSALPVLADFR